MSIQDTINNFVEEQKAKDVSDQEIDQTTQMAFMAVLAKTMKDLKTELTDEQIKQMTSDFSDPEQVKDGEFLASLAEKISLPDGTSMKVMLEQNMEKFFADLHRKLDS